MNWPVGVAWLVFIGVPGLLWLLLVEATSVLAAGAFGTPKAMLNLVVLLPDGQHTANNRNSAFAEPCQHLGMRNNGLRHLPEKNQARTELKLLSEDFNLQCVPEDQS